MLGIKYNGDVICLTTTPCNAALHPTAILKIARAQWSVPHNDSEMEPVAITKQQHQNWHALFAPSEALTFFVCFNPIIQLPDACEANSRSRDSHT